MGERSKQTEAILHLVKIVDTIMQGLETGLSSYDWCSLRHSFIDATDDLVQNLAAEHTTEEGQK